MVHQVWKITVVAEKHCHLSTRAQAAALRFVNFVDPALEQDIYADKPWALSPMIASE